MPDQRTATRSSSQTAAIVSPPGSAAGARRALLDHGQRRSSTRISASRMSRDRGRSGSLAGVRELPSRRAGRESGLPLEVAADDDHRPDLGQRRRRAPRSPPRSGRCFASRNASTASWRRPAPSARAWLDQARREPLDRRRGERHDVGQREDRLGDVHRLERELDPQRAERALRAGAARAATMPTTTDGSARLALARIRAACAGRGSGRGRRG